jgi:DNA-damage-inducible protein J
MNKSATIQTRIDPKLKNSASKIFEKLNISMSEAISLFLTQVTLRNGLPFEIRIPNQLTEETLLKSERGEDLHSVKDSGELFQELNS